MSYKEYISYFKTLEILDKIRHINEPFPATLIVETKKTLSVTSIVGKSSKYPKGSNMWCYYCNKTVTRLIGEKLSS
jgi:hypothetical protein